MKAAIDEFFPYEKYLKKNKNYRLCLMAQSNRIFISHASTGGKDLTVISLTKQSFSSQY